MHTHQEALENLKSIHYNKHGLYTDDSFAFELAFEALEKQIPMKPLPDTKYHTEGICPVCKVHFIDRTTNYCGNCGQALDWKNTNEDYKIHN